MATFLFVSMIFYCVIKSYFFLNAVSSFLPAQSHISVVAEISAPPVYQRCEVGRPFTAETHHLARLRMSESKRAGMQGLPRTNLETVFYERLV